MNEIKIRIDSLGRVVIPIKIRKKLGIELNSDLSMTFNEYGVIIFSCALKCAICGGAEKVIKELKVCKVCIDKIVIFLGNSEK